MKRFMSLALAFAVLVPLAVSDADAATKKKKSKGPQVAGFVQTAPIGGSTISISNPTGDRRYLNHPDNTQKFFSRLAENSR